MNEIEGNNIPEQQGKSKQPDKLEQKQEQEQEFAKLQERSRFSLFIAWVALFLTMIGIAAGYKNWMQINDRAKQAAMGVHELKQQATHFADKTSVVAFNTQLLSDLAEKEQHLAHSVEMLENIKKITQHAAQTVAQQALLLTQQQEQSHALATMPNTTWRLAELRFLLQLANQRLQLHKDKDGALQALKTAEMTLLKLGKKKYLPVRNKLAEEIVAIESFLVPNLSAISERITDFLAVIMAMPIDAEIAKQQKITLLPETSKEDTGFIARLVTGINNAVVIKKFDPTVQKSIGIDEKEKLKNLLQLRFETLRLMALQGLDYDYHQQLKLIKQILEKYYPDNIKGSLQAQLNELDKVRLSPPPPDISASLTLLNQLSTAGK